MKIIVVRRLGATSLLGCGTWCLDLPAPPHSLVVVHDHCCSSFHNGRQSSWSCCATSTVSRWCCLLAVAGVVIEVGTQCFVFSPWWVRVTRWWWWRTLVVGMKAGGGGDEG
jgi:hypothetical protein